MKLKVKIPLEEILPQLSHFPLQKVYDLLDDSVIKNLSNDAIIKKYEIILEEEQELWEILPKFKLDELHCKQCGQYYLFKVIDDRTIVRVRCDTCDFGGEFYDSQLNYFKQVARLDYLDEQEKRVNLSKGIISRNIYITRKNIKNLPEG